APSASRPSWRAATTMRFYAPFRTTGLPASPRRPAPLACRSPPSAASSPEPPFRRSWTRKAGESSCRAGRTAISSIFAKSARFGAKTFRNRWFLHPAALRPGYDFGMVPPIWGRPVGQGRPPFYAPAASRGTGERLDQHLEANSMTALWAIVLCGALSIIYAIWATNSVINSDAGNPRMQEIAAAVREGAQAYLKRQYTTIGLVGIVIFVVLAYFLGTLVAVGFLIGAVLSGSAGFIGMNVSVRANVRTAQAATTSLAGGLEL